MNLVSYAITVYIIPSASAPIAPKNSKLPRCRQQSKCPAQDRGKTRPVYNVFPRVFPTSNQDLVVISSRSNAPFPIRRAYSRISRRSLRLFRSNLGLSVGGMSASWDMESSAVAPLYAADVLNGRRRRRRVVLPCSSPPSRLYSLVPLLSSARASCLADLC